MAAQTRAAERAGARVIDSVASGIEETAGGVRVATGAGQVTAQKVLVAAGGFTNMLLAEPIRVIEESDDERFGEEDITLESLLLKLDDEQKTFVAQFEDKLPTGPWILKGGPGSGKSTAADIIANLLNDKYNSNDGDDDCCIVIPMDGWHIPQEQLLDKYGQKE